MQEFISRDEIEKVVMLLDEAGKIHFSKKSLIFLNPIIDQCLMFLIRHESFLSTHTLLRYLFNHWNFSRINMKNALRSLSKKYPQDVIFSVLSVNDSFPLKSLQSLIDIYMDQDISASNLVNIFAHFQEEVNEKDLFAIHPCINNLPGEIYKSDVFLYNSSHFFNIVHLNQLNVYFKKLFLNLCQNLEQCDDQVLLDEKILTLCRHLAISKGVTSALATRILTLHMKRGFHDHISLLHLIKYCDSKELQNEAKHKILPEVIFP